MTKYRYIVNTFIRDVYIHYIHYCMHVCVYVCVKQIDHVHQSAIHFLANGRDPGGTLGAHTITLGGHGTASPWVTSLSPGVFVSTGS